MPGLSTHFVPFTVPRNATGVRVVVETDAGVEPRVALFVGTGRFSGSARETRRIKPGRVVSSPFGGRPGKALTVEADFLSPSERDEVVLMISNGRATDLRYRLRFRSTQPTTGSNRYCGVTEQLRELCFDRAADATAVSNMSTEIRMEDCDPIGTFIFPAVIPGAVPVGGDGSFSVELNVTFGPGSAGRLNFQGRLDSTGGAAGTVQMIGIRFAYQGVSYHCRGVPIRWTARRP